MFLLEQKQLWHRNISLQFPVIVGKYFEIISVIGYFKYWLVKKIHNGIKKVLKTAAVTKQV